MNEQNELLWAWTGEVELRWSALLWNIRCDWRLVGPSVVGQKLAGFCVEARTLGEHLIRAFTEDAQDGPCADGIPMRESQHGICSVILFYLQNDGKNHEQNVGFGQELHLRRIWRPDAKTMIGSCLTA